jgi:hypothetical protein
VPIDIPIARLPFIGIGMPGRLLGAAVGLIIFDHQPVLRISYAPVFELDIIQGSCVLR